MFRRSNLLHFQFRLHGQLLSPLPFWALDVSPKKHTWEISLMPILVIGLRILHHKSKACARHSLHTLLEPIHESMEVLPQPLWSRVAIGKFVYCDVSICVRKISSCQWGPKVRSYRKIFPPTGQCCAVDWQPRISIMHWGVYVGRWCFYFERFWTNIFARVATCLIILKHDLKDLFTELVLKVQKLWRNICVFFFTFSYREILKLYHFIYIQLYEFQSFQTV